MSSAPVYSRNLNGMMVGAYSNADLLKMVQPDKPQAVAVPATMAFDVQPQRGHMLKIQQWLQQEAAVKHEALQHTHEYKARQTDSLLRDYLSQAIDAENARRANIEAEWGVPYAGVLAEQHRLAELARKGMKPPAAEPAAAPPKVAFVSPPRTRQPRAARGRSAAAVTESKFSTPHTASTMASPADMMSALRGPAGPLDALFRPRDAAASLSREFDDASASLPNLLARGVVVDDSDLESLPGFPAAVARAESGPPVLAARTRLASKSKK